MKKIWSSTVVSLVFLAVVVLIFLLPLGRVGKVLAQPIQVEVDQFVYLPMVSNCVPWFFDDFSDPNSGWPDGIFPRGILDYRNGIYFVKVTEIERFLVSLPDQKFSKYALGVDVRNVNVIDGRYGLLFGYNPISDGWYTFEIDADGRYYITRSETVLVKQSSAAIKKGTANNHLQVVRDGPTIRVSVNGQQVHQIQDSTFLGDLEVGLIATTFSEPDLALHFDNYSVTSVACAK